MSLSFSILGSGSAGNCTVLVLRDDQGDRKECLLIDCGLSPRATARRLAAFGITLRHITGILLTHLDWDHFHTGWVKAIERLGITIHAHQRHRGETYRAGIPMQRTALFTDTIHLNDLPNTRIESVALAHDQMGSVGYVIEHESHRLGFATDLGRVPLSLYERFHGLHALAIESNYDRAMQLSSDRPPFLKHRIMGGMGHLSNDQALDAVLRIAERSALSHVALLHLSRQCNDPQRVRKLYESHAAGLLDRLTIADQLQPTPMLEIRPGHSTLAPLRKSEPLTLFEMV